jgi:hypothetical protein
VDPQLLLPQGAGLVVEHVQLCDEIVHVTVRCEGAGAQCADCGAWSDAFNSSYERNLGDLPIAGRQTVIDLQVRRFRRHQPECSRKTFVEQAAILAEPTPTERAAPPDSSSPGPSRGDVDTASAVRRDHAPGHARPPSRRCGDVARDIIRCSASPITRTASDQSVRTSGMNQPPDTQF